MLKKILTGILGLLLIFAFSVHFNNLNLLTTAEASNLQQHIDPSTIKCEGDLAFVSDDFLYIMDGSTGKLSQLTYSGKAFCPRWSYDGKYLAFIKINDSQSNMGTLWIASRDEKQIYQVKGLPQYIGAEEFQWSPTENILAVGNCDINGLWIVPVNKEPYQLVNSKNLIWFAWSPDGKNIAYNLTKDPKDMENRGDILYTIGLDDKKPVKRVDLSGKITGIEVAKWWSDGKGLLYWTNSCYSSSLRADGLKLWTFDLDNGESKEIDDTLTYREWLSFSPEGKLLMVSGIGRENWINKKLIMADVKSGEIQSIKIPEGYVAIDPTFSPNGKNIAFVMAEELDDIMTYEEQKTWSKSRTLCIANADGTIIKPLIESHVYNPMWSKDGNFIYYIKDGALWQISVDGDKPKKVFQGIKDENTWGFYGYFRYTDWFDWY